MSEQVQEIAGKTDLSQFNNDWYHPGGSTLKRILWFLVNALFLISRQSHPCQYRNEEMMTNRCNEIKIHKEDRAYPAWHY